MFSAPAEWIQGLSFGACFKSLVPCCHLHFLSRTAPLSIRHVQNSRIWQIYREEHTFAFEKSLRSRFYDFEAWINTSDRADFVDFQMKVDLHFTTWKLGFLNISEYLARYRFKEKATNQTNLDRTLYYTLLGLLSTIIRGREQSDQESTTHGKIAQAIKHRWTLITSTSAREVVRTSARCLSHWSRSGFYFERKRLLLNSGESIIEQK